MQYKVLPFKFGRFRDGKFLIVNACGEHYFLSANDFKRFTEGKLSSSSELFLDLKGKHFASDYLFLFNWLFYIAMGLKLLLALLRNAISRSVFGGDRKPG